LGQERDVMSPNALIIWMVGCSTPEASGEDIEKKTCGLVSLVCFLEFEKKFDHDFMHKFFFSLKLFFFFKFFFPLNWQEEFWTLFKDTKVVCVTAHLIEMRSLLHGQALVLLFLFMLVQEAVCMCREGLYYNGVSCVSCPAGYSCAGGSTYALSIKVACEAGFYSSYGADVCSKCTAVGYSSMTAASSCTLCVPGTNCSLTRRHSQSNTVKHHKRLHNDYLWLNDCEWRCLSEQESTGFQPTSMGLIQICAINA
jgi:hypothetical protein